MKRRTFNDALALTLVVVGSGCGGGQSSRAAPVAPWLVGDVRLIRDGGSFDLRTTLPVGVPHDGVFKVSTLGTVLPEGFVLSPAGLLSATAGAIIAEDVVFEYAY